MTSTHKKHTVKVYDTLVQGTDEWLQARAGLVTASTVGELFTTKAGVSSSAAAHKLIRLLGIERATKVYTPTPTTWAMRRGSYLEGYARNEYSILREPVTEIGFMTRTIDGHTFGYSPDGLVGDRGLIEIKCLTPDQHATTHISHTPPGKYVPQLQFGLWVSGREWIDYVSFCPRYATCTLRIEPDPVWQDAFTTHMCALDTRIRNIANAYTAATSGLVPTPDIDLSGI